jgi:hypothetical protein
MRAQMSMSKKRKKIDGQLELKLDLYETLERIRTETVGGSFNIHPQIKSIITQTLKGCSLSRYQVAAGMSELLGTEITKFMLDTWTAESKEDHRFPLEFAPAFCRAAGDYTLIRFVCEQAGCYLIEGEDILLTEKGRLQKMKKEIQAAERRLDEYLAQLGGDPR